jgi:uncharacterized membrane protein YgdD (TMEM256/DUF423 family)
MEICYPSILLIIIAILLFIQISRNLWWGAGLVLGSIPLFFGFICLALCRNGHNKLAWIAPLGAVVFLGFISAFM